MANQQDSTTDVPVVFKIRKWPSEPDTEEIRVITSKFKNIRNWKLEETMAAVYTGSGFTLEVHLPGNRVVWYKLLVVRSSDNEVVHVENFERELILGTKPIVVKLEYNLPNSRITELRSLLTVSDIGLANKSKPAAPKAKPSCFDRDPGQCSEKDFHKACGDKGGPPTARKPNRKLDESRKMEDSNEDDASRASVMMKVAHFQSACLTTGQKKDIKARELMAKFQSDLADEIDKDDVGRSGSSETDFTLMNDKKVDKKNESDMREDADGPEVEVESDKSNDDQGNEEDEDDGQKSGAESPDSQESDTGSDDSLENETWTDVGQESEMESAYGHDSEIDSGDALDCESESANEGNEAVLAKCKSSENDLFESQESTTASDDDNENVAKSSDSPRIETGQSETGRSEAQSTDEQASETELERNHSEENGMGLDDDNENVTMSSDSPSIETVQYETEESEAQSADEQAAYTELERIETEADDILQVEEESAEGPVSGDGQEGLSMAAASQEKKKAESADSQREELEESAHRLQGIGADSNDNQDKKITGFSVLITCLINALTGGFPELRSLHKLYMLFMKR